MALHAEVCSFLVGPIFSASRRWYSVLIDDAGKVVWRSPAYRNYGRQKGEDRALKIAQAEINRREALGFPTLHRGAL